MALGLFGRQLDYIISFLLVSIYAVVIAARLFDGDCGVHRSTS
jgi:hypothetical protein